MLNQIIKMKGKDLFPYIIELIFDNANNKVFMIDRNGRYFKLLGVKEIVSKLDNGELLTVTAFYTSNNSTHLIFKDPIGCVFNNSTLYLLDISR